MMANADASIQEE